MLGEFFIPETPLNLLLYTFEILLYSFYLFLFEIFFVKTPSFANSNHMCLRIVICFRLFTIEDFEEGKHADTDFDTFLQFRVMLQHDTYKCARLY